jgi:hypothetical protein
MPGVSQEVAEHMLNIRPGSKPIKQGLRCFDQEKRQAMGEELSRLLAAGFVTEVQHPNWIADLVLIPKKSRKWWMCVDYMSLNKACLKDPFPLPWIDQVMDLTVVCEILSFLDAYSGYHQIRLAEVDQPATTFITPFRCFYYVKMLFRLKNAGLPTNGACSLVLRDKLGVIWRSTLMTSL